MITSSQLRAARALLKITAIDLASISGIGISTIKRFELSEDFQAKLTVEQLRTQLGQFGMTPETMFQQMHQTLERMKSKLDAPA